MNEDFLCLKIISHLHCSIDTNLTGIIHLMNSKLLQKEIRNESFTFLLEFQLMEKPFLDLFANIFFDDQFHFLI